MTTDEGRIGRVEGILEEVRIHLSNLENRMTALEARMQTQFYWLLGVMIPMWVTIMLAILLRM
jgi:hypothetical protein